MCDDVLCTWFPAIAYQGLCATNSEWLLIPSGVGILKSVSWAGANFKSTQERNIGRYGSDILRRSLLS